MGKTINQWYKEDLAYIHDIGFREHALGSAPGILAILQQQQISSGLIVDLGCGSGLLAQEFIKANYSVLGIDISESMINLARKRVPDAQFLVNSLFKAQIPPCHVVTCVGEGLNYLFDIDNQNTRLIDLFRRIYQALIPGGIFIFDIVELARANSQISKWFTEGKDWFVLVEKEKNNEPDVLTRRIITFRKLGEYYRRDEEVHRQKLYQGTDLAIKLNQVGFEVEMMRSYGDFALLPDRLAFVARK